ncbi:MAG TPA: OmpA family protein [Pseudoxanthomonas sp.]
MADASRCNALGFGRWFTLCFFALASALHADPAWAQTSITNTATVTPPSGVSCADAATNPTCVRSASDTDDVVAPSINVAKSAVGVSGPSALGVYTVSYTITVANSGTAAGTYGALTDTPVFPANTNITGIAWTTSGAGAPAGGSSTIDGPNQLTGTGIAIGAGVTHTFNVSITYVYTSATTPTTCAATPTPGSGLYNNASLPAGQETVTTDNATCVNPPSVPAASLTIDKTAGTPSGGSVGSTIAYTFVVTNTGTVTLSGIAVVDALLDAPAACGSTTLTPSAPGNTTTCTGVHTITAAEVATGSVSNSATATGSTSGGIVVTSPPDTTLTPLVPSVNFCAVNSVFNVTQTATGLGEFYRYTVGSGTPDVLMPELTLPVAPNLNGLMVDPVNNRLLFVSYSSAAGQATLHAYDAANGGWYVAAGPIATPDFPRAAMTQAGVGYLVAGNGNNPAVWRVAPSGAFNYTLTSYGSLTYDFAPTNASSGDIAFDSAGNGWLTAGVDLYKIDFSTTAVSATRQQRPLLNGAPSTLQWAGVAYGNDGLLYVATNTSPSRYFRIDLATGTLTQVAATAANQSRDLASCSFPAAPTPAQLQVEKTLAQVNGSAYVAGAAVAAGDTLTYQIEVTHVGGSLAATLFAGDVLETLPANTTAVAAGNNFTCAASNCTNTNAVNIPAGGSTTLNFVVQVVTPFPTGATASIVNAVAVDGVDCAAVGNDCGETTAVGLPAWTVVKSSTDTTFTTVGDVLDYSYLVSNTGNVAINAIAIADDRTTNEACPAATLAAGASMTCSATYTVTQADLDAGSVTNNVTMTGTPTTGTLPPAIDDLTINATATPSWTVVKSSADTAYSAMGDVLDYSYLVTNTGNVAISAIAIADDRTTNEACPTATLAAGAGMTCTATYTVTQADLDAGSVTNTVTMTGAPSSGTLPPAIDDLTINATATPSWTVVKSSVDTTYSAVGDILDYSYLVTNTGNVSISAIVIADDRTTNEACPAATLAAGASMTCTATYTVTQADLDTGSVTNNVALTGTPSSGTLPPAIDDLTLNATAAPAWNVVKSSTDTTFAAVGDVLDYSYVVTNTGNVAISAIVIADDRTTNEACPAATLVAGASMTCSATYTVTQADLDAGSVTNNVVLTGTPSSGTLPPAIDDLTLNATATPSWTVVKSSTDTTFAAVAEILDYSYLVTNTGNVAISAIAIADDRTSNEACPAATLAAGASMTCSATYTVTQADLDAGSITNTVTMTGTPSSGTLPPAIDDLTLNATANPAWTVVKSSVDTSYAAVGAVLDYTYLVTNTGNVAISAIAIADDRTSNEACPAATLAAGASMTCTATYTVTQADLDAGSVTNTVTMTGTPSSGVLPPAIDDLTLNATTAPALTLLKTAGTPSGNTAGSTIGYTFAVTNTGNVTLTGIAVTDALLDAPAVCDATMLLPGAVATCTGTHTITQAEANAGTVNNSATATGTPPVGPPVTSPPSTTTTPIASNPALTLVKTAGTPSGNTAGSTIGYSFVVTNTGNVTLTGIAVTDAMLDAPAVCDVTTLLPSAIANCTGTHTITQAEVNNGVVNNSATATGTPPVGPPVTSPPSITTTPITAAPALTLVKTAGTPSGNAAGSTIGYTFVATNTGNVTLSGIVINDAQLDAPAVCDVATLLPGAIATCTGTHTITQAEVNNGAVNNSATATGTPPVGPPVTSPPSTTTTPIAANPALTLVKTAGAPSGNTAGSTIGYTFVATNTGNVTLSGIAINDALLDAPAVCDATTLLPGAIATCTGTHTITQAEVNAGAVNNTATTTGTPPVGPPVTSPPSTTTTPIAPNPSLSVLKTAGTPSGNIAGSTIGYTFVVTNTGNVTLNAIAINDALLDAPAVCDATTLLPGAIATCTGTHTITQAEVAAGVVNNTATATGTPPSGPAVPSNSSTTSTPLLAVTVSKLSNPASGQTVQPGDTISYTLNVVVANTATTSALTLTDTLSGDQTLAGPLPAGCASGAGGLVCTLAAGTQPGSYSFNYATTVDADATGRLGNNVVPSGTDNPTCSNCSTEHPIAASVVTVAKTSNPASGAEVAPGDTVSYTLTVSVANSITTGAVTLTDTISGDQSLSGALPAGCAASGNGLVCTLPAGTLPGSYSFSYSTRVAADATGTLGNVVVPSGSDAPTCVSCSTSHRVVATAVTVSKTSNPASGTSVSAGDTLSYTLAVTVTNSVTTDAVTLTDTISGDQTLTGVLPAGCAATANGLRCTLPAGTLPGTYTFAYATLVDTDATGTVGNVVVPTGGDSPTCALACSTEHAVLSDYQLRILKTVAVREVKIGDLVRYTLSVENVGNGRLINGSIVDTPPPGFSYVEGSLSVTDGDNQATAVGQSPLRFEGLDIEPGQTATLMYAMRVGAGVRPGVQRNQAQAYTQTGSPISNVSTAAVALVADALVDDSLLIGTVFDDRDGDTWQDSAALSGVRVQGGFAPEAYVANSTTVDRGAGAQPEADASSPLLHGIDVGAIGARQSAADPVEHHRVVIRQRLNQPSFTNDFVLTSAQGVNVRMDAAGNTTVEKSGEAAKGLNAAEPKVERRVAQGEGGYVVDYVISNLGIDERGIPGVRIASVEGLLIETDQFGRYHLEGIAGGDSGRGRNFILKVDPSTLPAGTAFTTDNPLVRRITPGLPVRFDFGVKLPVEEIEGGEQQVELELGEVIFAPGSAKIREPYWPVIAKIADKVVEYRGGEVLVSANGDSQELAFDRADAVKTALLRTLPQDLAKTLTVSVRTELDDPATLLVGIAEGGPLLGTVLFDTDKSVVKPQFLPLIDKIAAYLDAKGGGAVAIVGHADPRGSDAYNAALGMHRAKAVYDLIAEKLSPAVRAQVRVESSNDPAAPAGTSK